MCWCHRLHGVHKNNQNLGSGCRKPAQRLQQQCHPFFGLVGHRNHEGYPGKPESMDHGICQDRIHRLAKTASWPSHGDLQSKFLVGAAQAWVRDTRKDGTMVGNPNETSSVCVCVDMNSAGNLCTCGVCRLSNTAGIFDVDTLMILLRLALCSRVRT